MPFITCEWNAAIQNLCSCCASWHLLLITNNVYLKRLAGDLADPTKDEMKDFLNVVKRVAGTLRSAFNATMFNWSCYMNYAYQENSPNLHVHWWAVPRYAHTVKFGERTFEDPHFGNPYDHGRWLDLPKNLRDEIAEKIRETYV